MVSKKQRFITFLFVIILAAAIVGGVFAITYFKGGVTFPWQVTVSTTEEKETASEPKEEPKLVVKEKAKDTEKKTEETKPKKETKVEKKEEEPAPTYLGNGTKLKYYGQLSVDGTKLVDENGDDALLMGVSTHGINWYPDYASPETIKSLREDWGINVIRLAMYTSDYNGYCVGGKENQENLKNIIDDAVKAATDNDMYVIIDWHILNDNNPNEYKSEAIQFFGEMVRKYESNENVIYEICNEPNGDTTWEDIRDYANEVIPVIRNVNEDAIILVGTPKWSSDLYSVLDDPLEFDNIMYTYHFYAATHGARERDKLRTALEEGLPVFISEYGLVSADGNGEADLDEADDWYDLMQETEFNLSSCMWNFSNKDEGSAMINSDCDKLEGFTEDEISESAQFLLDTIGNYHDSTFEDGVYLNKNGQKTDKEKVSDSKNNKSKKSEKLSQYEDEKEDIEEDLEEDSRESLNKDSKSDSSKDKDSKSNSSKDKNSKKTSNSQKNRR
ncbi:endoglucanase [Pseudobutyrivibrio sp. YE44]|uniref:glycoside hydrolase family 5 protein n=1 Tax=Pseudobutyrivibrio sp. YE44 TaxID=1520802 RepID=UPI000890600F|nr:glycoside hydrolase family 5 protein [Pseudobutyrivibrio sp. YE44]SDB40945.1 endoglucanase [Pseudobutyrivibrio sp. YE44]